MALIGMAMSTTIVGTAVTMTICRQPYPHPLTTRHEVQRNVSGQMFPEEQVVVTRQFSASN